MPLIRSNATRFITSVVEDAFPDPSWGSCVVAVVDISDNTWTLYYGDQTQFVLRVTGVFYYRNISTLLGASSGNVIITNIDNYDRDLRAHATYNADVVIEGDLDLDLPAAAASSSPVAYSYRLSPYQDDADTNTQVIRANGPRRLATQVLHNSRYEQTVIRYNEGPNLVMTDNTFRNYSAYLSPGYIYIEELTPNEFNELIDAESSEWVERVQFIGVQDTVPPQPDVVNPYFANSILDSDYDLGAQEEPPHESYSGGLRRLRRDSIPVYEIPPIPQTNNRRTNTMPRSPAAPTNVDRANTEAQEAISALPPTFTAHSRGSTYGQTQLDTISFRFGPSGLDRMESRSSFKANQNALRSNRIWAFTSDFFLPLEQPYTEEQQAEATRQAANRGFDVFGESNGFNSATGRLVSGTDLFNLFTPEERFLICGGNSWLTQYGGKDFFNKVLKYMNIEVEQIQGYGDTSAILANGSVGHLLSNEKRMGITNGDLCMYLAHVVLEDPSGTICAVQLAGSDYLIVCRPEELTYGRLIRACAGYDNGGEGTTRRNSSLFAGAWNKYQELWINFVTRNQADITEYGIDMGWFRPALTEEERRREERRERGRRNRTSSSSSPRRELAPASDEPLNWTHNIATRVDFETQSLEAPRPEASPRGRIRNGSTISWSSFADTRDSASDNRGGDNSPSGELVAGIDLRRAGLQDLRGNAGIEWIYRTSTGSAQTTTAIAAGIVSESAAGSSITSTAARAGDAAASSSGTTGSQGTDSGPENAPLERREDDNSIMPFDLGWRVYGRDSNDRISLISRINEHGILETLNIEYIYRVGSAIMWNEVAYCIERYGNPVASIRAWLLFEAAADEEIRTWGYSVRAGDLWPAVRSLGAMAHYGLRAAYNPAAGGEG